MSLNTIQKALDEKVQVINAAAHQATLARKAFRKFTDEVSHELMSNISQIQSIPVLTSVNLKFSDSKSTACLAFSPSLVAEEEAEKELDEIALECEGLSTEYEKLLAKLDILKKASKTAEDD
jgi:hypothetical protein